MGCASGEGQVLLVLSTTDLFCTGLRWPRYGPHFLSAMETPLPRHCNNIVHLQRVSWRTYSALLREINMAPKGGQGEKLSRLRGIPLIVLYSVDWIHTVLLTAAANVQSIPTPIPSYSAVGTNWRHLANTIQRSQLPV